MGAAEGAGVDSAAVVDPAAEGPAVEQALTAQPMTRRPIIVPGRAPTVCPLVFRLERHPQAPIVAHDPHAVQEVRRATRELVTNALNRATADSPSTYPAGPPSARRGWPSVLGPGVRAYRRDLVAALILDAREDAASLDEMIRRLGMATAGNALVSGYDAEKILTFSSPGPGRRPHKRGA